MKQLLLKKLSAFIVTAMMFSVSAIAQIVYTDVNPDVVKTCTRKSLKGVFNLQEHQKNNSLNETGSLREIPDSLDKFILKSMKNHHIPGLAAAIIKDGKIAWTKGYGYANIEKNIPFTPNTIHAEIASVSKTVCATALLKLYEQGVFQLDDPINNYLPFTVTNPYFPNVPITFHMLLNHTSSINDYGLFYSPYLEPGTAGTLPDFLQSILVPGGAFYADSTSYYNYPPGSQWNYSNYGYALIGYLVEYLSGMSFDEYCNQNIFQPLCLNNTGWHFSDVDSNIVSHPYFFDDANSAWIDYGLYEYGDYPDGQLKTSVTDLSRFLLMLMNNGIVDGIRILDSTTVTLMKTPELEIAPNIFSGLCLFYYADYGGFQYWGHNGGDLGIATEMWFNPNNSTGIILFINSEDDAVSFCTAQDDIFCQLSYVADTISTSSQPALNCSYAEFPCQHSKTYWKNHNDEWALNSVPMKLGTTHFYGQNKLLNLLNKPINGNASTVLAKQLIAAKLNAAQGSELSPIITIMNQANYLIGNRNLPVQPAISFFSSEGIQMLALSVQLAAYNYRVLNTESCNGSTNGNRDEGEQLEDIYENGLTEQSLIISPNPLSSFTTISFSLNELQNVSLKVFDLNGRLIKTLADNVFEEGEHSVVWNVEEVNAGIYFLQVQTAEYSRTEKLIVTK